MLGDLRPEYFLRIALIMGIVLIALWAASRNWSRRPVDDDSDTWLDVHARYEPDEDDPHEETKPLYGQPRDAT